MLDWKLPLFPQDSVAVTVTVTVWIGVCLVVFFNLRLGWPLSGLVVPGYLAPLLLAQPASAAIICAEAMVTYLIVYALSESCSRLSCWSSLFRRDRFFALVLFSVLVRAVADGWLLPWLGQWLNESARVGDRLPKRPSQLRLDRRRADGELFLETGSRRAAV